jgi:hypothetical protein
MAGSRYPNASDLYDRKTMQHVFSDIEEDIDAISAQAVSGPQVITAVDADTTPSLKAVKRSGQPCLLLVPAVAGPYTITDFIDQMDGQVVIVMNSGSANVTINRDNAKLETGLNKVLTPWDSLILVDVAGTWVQISSVVMAS